MRQSRFRILSQTTHVHYKPGGAIFGDCPDCQAEIAAADILIENEASDAQPMVWAECPHCTEVIHPV